MKSNDVSAAVPILNEAEAIGDLSESDQLGWLLETGKKLTPTQRMELDRRQKSIQQKYVEASRNGMPE
jgi:hypothetical protein